LRDQLLNAKRKGLDSDEYNGALSSVLKVLYELVGRPVIRRLNELNVPEQSRVWWCPTSVFCSLPLHAMGPIPSNDDVPVYFSDLYIPSYAPSLSTLTESQRPSACAWDKPSILPIALPDESMPGASEEMRVIRAVRFAHFACHGVLEPGRPFQASLKLYDGQRLTLLDIAQSQLPDVEFAFLSASHTAELTDESIPDEALHLAAAMQHCGFRSVVGTMWSMVDADGRNVVETFYNSVFSDSDNAEQDVVPLVYYERTAKALRDAVKWQRRKRGITLERWVNFVHYGA
jgi:CHAT domain